MKKIILGILGLCCLPALVFSNFTYSNHALTLGADIPPALIFVTDSNGNIAGVDVTQPVDQYGAGTSVKSISGSDVEQVNIGTDENPAQSSATTSWTISFVDQPAQIYTLHIVGVDTGASEIGFSVLYKGQKPLINNQLSFIVGPGLTKTAEINFDPVAQTLSISPTVSSSDLLVDTQAACGLEDIGPPEACAVLEVLASEAEKSIIRHDTQSEANELKVYLRVLNRLHYWGQNGHRQDWNDFCEYSECGPLCRKGFRGTKFFANDPAYSALKLDADTLLDALSGTGLGHHHR